MNMVLHKGMQQKKVFDPTSSKCRICKQANVQKMYYYCQKCSYAKGICSMCGKKILDIKMYKQKISWKNPKYFCHQRPKKLDFHTPISKNINLVGLNMKHLLLQTSMLIDLIMYISIFLFNPRLDHCFQMKVDIWSSFFSKREPE